MDVGAAVEGEGSVERVFHGIGIDVIGRYPDRRAAVADGGGRAHHEAERDLLGEVLGVFLREGEYVALARGEHEVGDVHRVRVDAVDVRGDVGIDGELERGTVVDGHAKARVREEDIVVPEAFGNALEGVGDGVGAGGHVEPAHELLDFRTADVDLGVDSEGARDPVEVGAGNRDRTGHADVLADGNLAGSWLEVALGVYVGEGEPETGVGAVVDVDVLQEGDRVAVGDGDAGVGGGQGHRGGEDYGAALLDGVGAFGGGEEQVDRAFNGHLGYGDDLGGDVGFPGERILGIQGEGLAEGGVVIADFSGRELVCRQQVGVGRYGTEPHGRHGDAARDGFGGTEME